MLAQMLRISTHCFGIMLDPRTSFVSAGPDHVQPVRCIPYKPWHDAHPLNSGSSCCNPDRAKSGVTFCSLLLQHLYPKLGQELPERSYGSDCRLWIPGQGVHWQVIYDTVFDEFVIAHTLGWWGKALIIRDYTMLWTLSIGFELMEMTFHHMLPNFNECW